jgi:nucleotide-binding universal stress UspA family protein
MGTNGKDSLKDYMIGTTASYIVENSKTPVLVIP